MADWTEITEWPLLSIGWRSLILLEIFTDGKSSEFLVFELIVCDGTRSALTIVTSATKSNTPVW